MAELMDGAEHDTECEHEHKRGKHGTASTSMMCESVEHWHGHVPAWDSVRRSKRVAARMMGAEDDTQHAHKRGRHESVIASVHVGVEPWRDK